MSWKVIIGLLLLITGLAGGVIDWIKTGLVGDLPLIGLILCVVGGYLLVSGIFKRKKRGHILLDEIGKIGAITAGFIIGTVAYEKLSEYFKEREAKQSISNEELIKLEERIDSLYANREMESEKYVKLKTLIMELKKRRNLE